MQGIVKYFLYGIVYLRRFYVVILLSGKRGSGKDTVYSYLSGVGVKRLAFADKLKDMVAEEYNIPREWLDDRERKEMPLEQYPVEIKDEFTKMIHTNQWQEYKTIDGLTPTGFWIHNDGFWGSTGNGVGHKLYQSPRSLAILKGSTNRSVDSDYWVKIAIRDTKEGFNYAVTDARYRNEVEATKKACNGKHEVITVRIERPGLTVNSTDSSEIDLDDYQFDHYLYNDGSLSELKAATLKLFANLSR